MMAIVGSGEYLPPMDDVDRALLARLAPGSGGGAPTVVCLPTAAGREGDAMIDDWMHRGIDHFRRLGADAEGVRVWNRDTADDPAAAEQVASADLVYLSGGNPAYLHETLDSTAVWRSILSVIERGGMLVGCSAGAMIQGEQFMGGIRPRTGFGLWPGVHVVPHFDEIPSAIVSTVRATVGRKHTIVGVNGDTALLRDGTGHHVIGDEVTIWTSEGRTTHGPGELPAGLLPS